MVSSCRLLFLFLFLPLLLICCFKQNSIQYHQIKSHYPPCFFKQKKLTFGPPFAPYEIEEQDGPEAVRVYLNCKNHFFSANEEGFVKLEIKIKEEIYCCILKLFEGGQRLLLPDPLANKIIQAIELEEPLFLSSSPA